MESCAARCTASLATARPSSAAAAGVPEATRQPTRLFVQPASQAGVTSSAHPSEARLSRFGCFIFFNYALVRFFTSSLFEWNGARAASTELKCAARAVMSYAPEFIAGGVMAFWLGSKHVSRQVAQGITRFSACETGTSAYGSMCSLMRGSGLRHSRWCSPSVGPAPTHLGARNKGRRLAGDT